MKKEKDEKKEKKGDKPKALKDWLIVQNNERHEIKKGEAVDVPEKFLEVLKTEKVI